MNSYNSDYERLALLELIRAVEKLIKEGQLSGDYYSSRQFMSAARLLLVLIKILEPLPYADVKRISGMVLMTFVFVGKDDSEVGKEIDNTWETYRATFFSKFKKIIPEIIEHGYLKFKIGDHNIAFGNGLSIKISSSAFVELYKDLDPDGFPVLAREYYSALNQMTNKLSTSESKPAKKLKKEYKSITRARAFCIKLMQDEGIINYYDSENMEWLKTDLIDYIEKLWVGQSGQTVYENFLKINARYESFMKEHRKDFEYGQTIFESLRH